MQRSYAGRLARRLSTLFVLVIALAAVSSAPAPSESFGCYCVREMSEEGCRIQCCCGLDCYSYPC
jgi:hypothetical protein